MNAIIPDDFEKLNSKDPKLKFGFAKELIEIAKSDPEVLYPYFDKFTVLLKSDNQIIKWTAIDVIGYLSTVDFDNKVDQYIKVFIKYLSEGHLITANHAIFSLSKIALYKPEFTEDIIHALLKIDHYRFETEECRNIAIGKVIEAFANMHPDYDDHIFGFLKNALHNSRTATRKKAGLALRRLYKHA